MSNQPNGHGPSADGHPGHDQNGEQDGYSSSPSSPTATATEKVAPAPTSQERLKHAGTNLPDKRTVDLDDYFVCPLDKV